MGAHGRRSRPLRMDTHQRNCCRRCYQAPGNLQVQEVCENARNC